MASHLDGQPYVRLIKRKEINDLALLFQHAFLNDPFETYFSVARSVLTTDSKDKRRRESLELFFRFMIRLFLSIGSRVTVVAVPGQNGQPETLAAGTIWRPPNTNMEVKNPWILIRSGGISVTHRWGLSLEKRIFAVVQASDTSLKQAYESQNIKSTPEESWYLALAGTGPGHQGKGYMSLLIRDAFGHADPNSIFTLEASTESARDKYAHWGFTPAEPFVIGKGLVDERGVIEPDKAKAVGIRGYPMLRME